MIDDEMVEDLEMKVTKELGMGIRTGVQGCHAVDSPPSKAVPRTAHGRIIGPPGPKSQPYLVPPAADGPPVANCSLFTIAFATALAYGEQPGCCLLDQNKVRQHLLKPAGGGDDTTPIGEELA